LEADGTVWAWGANWSGQLGDGTATQRLLPVMVVGIQGVAMISAGSNHSAALRRDETVWAWGNGGNGQMGNGSASSKYSPVRVRNLTDIIRISTSGSHTLALKRDGTIWSWGANGHGQLGIGEVNSRKTTPSQVIGITNATDISAGGNHSMALLEDGTVRAWGLNSSGQLGEGIWGSPRMIPVIVSSLTNVKCIGTGFGHSLAFKEDWALWVWGLNSSGQLGDGTTINRNTPIEIMQFSFGTPSLSIGSTYTIDLRAEDADPTLFSGTKTITYDPVKLQLIDFAMQVPGQRFTASGAIPGTGLNILSHTSGEIRFTASPPVVPVGNVWTGTVTVLRFEVLQTGVPVVQIS
jgi:hypothetical protein